MVVDSGEALNCRIARPEPVDQPPRFALRRSTVALAKAEGRAQCSWFDKLTTSGKCGQFKRRLRLGARPSVAQGTALVLLVAIVAAFPATTLTLRGFVLGQGSSVAERRGDVQLVVQSRTRAR